MVRLKRVYEELSPDDGKRVLVERLWPRGVSKEEAHVDLWLKDIAPSPELRKWFGHDPEKWEEFRKLYWQELDRNHSVVSKLRDLIQQSDVTFIYAAHDEVHNSAVILKEYLEQ